MPDLGYFANLIWQIADLLRGPYRPPQYERVMLPMTVLRRFDCVLAPTKAKVLAAARKRRAGGRMKDKALDVVQNRVAEQRFHNRSPLDFERLQGDPDHIDKHFVSYGDSADGDRSKVFDNEPDTELRDLETVPLKTDVDDSAAVTGQIDVGEFPC